MIKKKKKKNKKKNDKNPISFPTINSQRIYDFMKSKKIRGKYKDYVLIIGSSMIDWLGSYEIRIEEKEGLKRIGVNGVALVHKSKLGNIIGKEAERFWKSGFRTNFGIEVRNNKCYRKANV